MGMLKQKHQKLFRNERQNLEKCSVELKNGNSVGTLLWVKSFQSANLIKIKEVLNNTSNSIQQARYLSL